MAARTRITPVNLALNDSVDVKAATVGISLVSSMYFSAADVARDQRILLHVKNTAAAVLTVTVNAGDMQGAREAITETVVASTGEKMIIFESARVRKANGQVYVTMSCTGGSSIIAGLALAYKLPV